MPTYRWNLAATMLLIIGLAAQGAASAARALTATTASTTEAAEAAQASQPAARFVKNTAANNERLDRLRLMLREYSKLRPDSTYVRRDDTQGVGSWNTSTGQPQKPSYACKQLLLHEPTLQYGLRWPGRLPVSPKCETWYLSYQGDYGGVPEPPIRDWMVANSQDGRKVNDCVRTVVEACRISEREFFQSLLTLYLETVAAVVSDQLLLDSAVASRSAGNSGRTRTGGATAANRNRLDTIRATIAEPSRLLERDHFTKVMTEYVELLSAIVDDHVLLDRALATSK